jgi:hypothetical protein
LTCGLSTAKLKYVILPYNSNLPSLASREATQGACDGGEELARESLSLRGQRLEAANLPAAMTTIWGWLDGKNTAEESEEDL